MRYLLNITASGQTETLAVNVSQTPRGRYMVSAIGCLEVGVSNSTLRAAMVMFALRNGWGYVSHQGA